MPTCVMMRVENLDLPPPPGAIAGPPCGDDPGRASRAEILTLHIFGLWPYFLLAWTALGALYRFWWRR